MDRELTELRQAVRTMAECQAYLEICDDKEERNIYMRLTRPEYRKYKIAVKILDAAMEKGAG